jgi:phosphate transport system substrate-binding protein
MCSFKIKTAAIVLLSLVLHACGGQADAPPTPTDTPNSGTIHISVDETYQPVIEEQIKVFQSSFPDAHIIAHYKPEAECFQDLFADSARLILVTRDLSDNEKKLSEQQRFVPTSLAIAKDAVAVVVNPSSPDSQLSLATLKGILTGQYKAPYTVVLDNQGSSTLRYIVDSLIPGEKLGANVFAVKNNSEVAEYVAKNASAIGFTGLSYVSDADTAAERFLSKVKVAAMYNDSAQQFYRPYQAYIAMKLYPLTRKLYYITRENYQGLGKSFANFLAQDRGQLIFYHAHLFPLRMNVVIREAAINRKS